jgi:polysaccharide pyruvyl transferase WcaK-like protein
MDREMGLRDARQARYQQGHLDQSDGQKLGQSEGTAGKRLHKLVMAPKRVTVLFRTHPKTLRMAITALQRSKLADERTNDSQDILRLAQRERATGISNFWGTTTACDAVMGSGEETDFAFTLNT